MKKIMAQNQAPHQVLLLRGLFFNHCMIRSQSRASLGTLLIFHPFS